LLCSTLCVDRAVPRWGKPEDGHASAKTVNHPRLSNLAPFLGQPGGAPGASLAGAAAALVTADTLAALGAPLCSTRLPAPYNACGRRIAAAGARNTWEEGDVRAQTPPPQPRPATADKVSEGAVTLYGTAYRAVVVHASAQDKRRQQRLARAIHAS
jgi:hypothetical protein